MNRKLVGGLVALVVALVAVWFLWLRGDGDKPKPASGSGRTAEITPPAKPPEKPADEADAPRAMAPRWSLDLDPAGPIRLEGQVVGPDGTGVGGAEVWLSSVPPRTAKAEEDGTFSFDKLVGRTYALSAKSGDLIGGMTYKLTASSDPVVIRLGEGATVVVSVVTSDGKRPVANAEVRSGDAHETTAKTDGKGEATLKPLSPGYAGVEVEADGYAPAAGFTTVGSAGAVGRLTITVHRGFAISGHVVDDTGKPVAKAHVSIGGFGGFERFEREQPEGGKPDPNIATTDDKGQFSIRAIAAGTHILAALDGEHAPVRSAPITITDRAVTGVQLVMKAGGVIAGTVVDATKKPVAFATVRVAGADEQMMQVAGRQATTDAKGAFELRGVSRAKLQARAESESAASKLLALDLTEKREARDLELVLDVTGTISGIVVDDKGAPVPEVQVSAFPDILGGESMEGMMLASMSPATTDGAGAFTITGLPDGAYRLWAARSTSASGGWGRDHTSAKTGDKNVRITLAAAGGIKGTIVVDGGGAPKLANVSVGWQAPTPAQDGAFEIKELAAGTYDVTFRGPDFAVTTKRDAKVEPGKTVDLGAVTVHRGRKVTGKVVDRKGQPIAGAKVKLGEMLMFSDDDKPDDDEDAMENMGGIRSAVSDQDGRFSIIGVPVKATTLAADHPTAGRSVSVAILDGKQDPPPVTLTLRGFGSISGKVTQQGKPLANVAVTHSSKGGGAQLGAAETDDQGNFTMKKVPEGAVVLQVMQNKMMSMKTTTTNTHVTAGKETKVTIDFPVGQVTLVVQIKPAAGHKVDAAQVFLFAGTALPANGKQLMDSFIAGGAQGMKFWFGEGKPLPEFDELVPGDYSICTIPITGDMGDPQFMQRINENVATLKVYCRKTTVAASPLKQTMTQEVPAMAALPAPAN